jgi:hypothetical protein
MLEILLIIAISKKMAAMLKEKGRSATGYVILFVVLWFGGEFFGAIAGTALLALQNPANLEQGFSCVTYIFALIGAAIGGGIGYAIAAAATPVDDPIRRAYRDTQVDDEDEDDDRPRPRRRRDRDDGTFEEPRDQR